MCGIAGIVGDGQGIGDHVETMVTELKHRGPDECGVKTLHGATLGHTRLSIIDLNGGHQPMSCSDNRYHITYNGEIYNYRELRKNLEKDGFHFKTQSDTEVLLNLYIQQGASCVEKLNGMFAFAIWDQQERMLFAARDRAGKKPFYYTELEDGSFVFASELKAILKTGMIRGRIDKIALNAYLSLGYVPPDRSIFSNFKVLAPGNMLITTSEKTEVSIYWSVDTSTKSSISTNESVEEFQRIFQNAVTRRMVADVPVGAFLSGGLDSSTIVSLMQRQSSIPVRTFSVGFGGLINELPFALAVSKQEQTKHLEIQMDLSVADLLVKMSEIFDEPFADSSNIPTYEVSRIASSEVKVVLTGEGADELLGGYDWWYQPLLRGQQLPSNEIYYLMIRLGCRAMAIASRLGMAMDGLNANLWDKRHLIETAKQSSDVLDWHLDRVNHFPNSLRKNLLGNKFEPVRFSCPEHLQGLERVFWFDTSQFLAGDILTKVDRASMAVGLESRSPFLDPELLQFCMELPHRLKFHDGKGKYLLRAAFQDLWPDAIKKRNKQGFGAPELAWLRRPDVKNLLDEVVFNNHSILYDLMDKNIIQQGVEKFYNQGQGFTGSQMWTLLVLALWLQQWSGYIETF